MIYKRKQVVILTFLAAFCFPPPKCKKGIIRRLIANQVHGDLTPAGYAASSVEKYHYPSSVSLPCRLQSDISEKFRVAHHFALCDNPFGQVDHGASSFGWGCPPPLGNVSDEWYSICKVHEGRGHQFDAFTT